MKIVAYYHEETDVHNVTRKSVGLEKREAVVDEPLVLERDALECIDMFGHANERLSRRIKDLKAELAALKAQVPVAWLDTDGELYAANVLAGLGIKAHKLTPLYAAPVSEAKAQGVVMPERKTKADYGVYIDEFADEAAAIYNAALDEVARLNAAPVQQVSVPGVSAMARILADRNADACNVNREDNWAIYGQGYIDDVTAMLAAAPAAPAIGAGVTTHD